jgi:hypothetical protein
MKCTPLSEATASATAEGVVVERQRRRSGAPLETAAHPRVVVRDSIIVEVLAATNMVVIFFFLVDDEFMSAQAGPETIW